MSTYPVPESNPVVTPLQQFLYQAPKTGRSIILYHADCVDGWAAEAILHTHLTAYRNQAVQSIPVSYSEDLVAVMHKALNEDSVTPTNLFVVDFSLTVPILCWLAAEFSNVRTIILDHHKTAFERYGVTTDLGSEAAAAGTVVVNLPARGGKAVLDINECGASLVYYQLYPHNALPEIVAYIKDWDLWQHKLGMDTTYVHHELQKAVADNVAWLVMAKAMAHPVSREFLLQAGKDTETELQKAVAEAVDNLFPITILGKGAVATFAEPSLASKVGHELAKITGTYGAIISDDKHTPHHVKVSLRSIGDFDVSAIAASYGGGGHKNAAGFTCPKDYLFSRCTL